MSYLLERTLLVPRPVSETFEFFSRAENLSRLTPPEIGFHIVTPQPIAMRAGTRIDYKVRVAGIPLSWRTHITEWMPGVYFVDEQERGPYRLWRHRHTFEAIPDGTRVRDHLEYDLPFGPLGGIAHALFVRRQLRRIFDYRAQRIAEIFPRLPARA